MLANPYHKGTQMNNHQYDDFIVTPTNTDEPKEQFTGDESPENNHSFMSPFNESTETQESNSKRFKQIILIIAALAALGTTGFLVKKYYDDEQLKKQEIENLKIEQEAIKKINEAKESQVAKEKEMASAASAAEQNRIENEAKEAEKQKIIDQAKKIKSKTNQEWFTVKPQ